MRHKSFFTLVTIVHLMVSRDLLSWVSSAGFMRIDGATVRG
jgi:hypothetical protein